MMTSKENKNGVILIEICRERLNPRLYHMRIGDRKRHHRASQRR